MLKVLIKELFLSDKLQKEIFSVSNSNANLLILGESGVGKDVIARSIHQKSKRSDRDPVFVNVAAIPDDLLEKELFGSIKGSFTGAEEHSVGKFRMADGSTLILDEIGELPLALQGKLIKFIEQGIVEPIGSNELFKVDCRIICITNKNLFELVNNGLFRKDLYYRLNVLTIEIPPLRERIPFIKSIADSFLKDLTPKNSNVHFDNNVYEKLILYKWPGNIRELKNSIERAIVLSDSEKITSEYLLLSSDNNGNISSATLKDAMHDFKRKYILQILESNEWNVTKSAKILGIQRTYLSRLIKELYNE